jgi:hypothetical protein
MNVNDSNIALIGVAYRPNDGTWTVQNNRKALKHEFLCIAKAEVLEKIAEILDDMSHPPGKLSCNNEDSEVVVAVTLQASLCDLNDEVNMPDLRLAAAQAVLNAVQHHEQEGFAHALADKVAFGVRGVGVLSVE